MKTKKVIVTVIFPTSPTLPLPVPRRRGDVRHCTPPIIHRVTGSPAAAAAAHSLPLRTYNFIALLFSGHYFTVLFFTTSFLPSSQLYRSLHNYTSLLLSSSQLYNFINPIPNNFHKRHRSLLPNFTSRLHIALSFTTPSSLAFYFSIPLPKTTSHPPNPRLSPA